MKTWKISFQSSILHSMCWSLAHNLAILLLIWTAFHFGRERPRSVDDGSSNSNSNADYPSDRDANKRKRINMSMSMNMNITAMNPPIFAAVNRHGLIVFILVNLMTGIVNLSINTLEASRGLAIVVIFLYLCSVGAVALLIDKLSSDRALRLKTK